MNAFTWFARIALMLVFLPVGLATAAGVDLSDTVVEPLRGRLEVLHGRREDSRRHATEQPDGLKPLEQQRQRLADAGIDGLAFRWLLVGLLRARLGHDDDSNIDE